jgi:hypothetical protein
LLIAHRSHPSVWAKSKFHKANIDPNHATPTGLEKQNSHNADQVQTNDAYFSSHVHVRLAHTLHRDGCHCGESGFVETNRAGTLTTKFRGTETISACAA